MDLEAIRTTLMAPGFDVKKHASQVISSGADVAAYLEELSLAEQATDALLQEAVASHHEDLLAQATGIEAVEAHLDVTQTHVSALLEVAERIRTRVREPYRSMTIQTNTLARFQEAADLLRRIIRILQLCKKLQSQIKAGPSEMAKAALSISELSELWSVDLNNIEIIEQEQRLAMMAKVEIERGADGILLRGLEAQNQTHMSIALQVYQNLALLENKLENLLNQQLKTLKTKLRECLDVKRLTSQAAEDKTTSGSSSANGGGPGRAAMPSPGNISSFRAVLFSNLESFLEAVHVKTCELVALQKLMCKKRDLTTHLAFAELANARGHVLQLFWDGVLSIVKDGLQKAAADSNFLKQALEGEYPKLLRLVSDMWSRLHQAGVGLAVDGGDKLPNPLATAHMDSSLRETLSTFERAYLSRALSRLFDPVNLMFSSGEVPSDTELSQVFKGVASELNIASVDPQLSLAVSRNVAKTVKLMCVKCEQILVMDGEASQVIGYPTEGQRKNVAIVNVLSKFRAGIEEIVAAQHGKSPEAVDVVMEALGDIERQVRAAVAPLLSSVEDAINAIIASIHREDFSSDDTSDAASTKTCSLCMKELHTFVARVNADFLREFRCVDVIASCALPLAARGMAQFVLHASLIRPLGKAGQMRLASDCAQLELALEPILELQHKAAGGASPVVAQSTATLRAFREMLFMLPEDVVESAVLGRALPHTIALHFLYAKADAPLKSPHDSMGWSISRYVQWLDDHPRELERLQFLQGTLESYVQSLRARQEKSYDYPYTIMLKLLERGLQFQQQK